MFRIALLLCYLTATLAGPRPCCCAAPGPPPPPAQTSTPTPARSACPHCAAEKKSEQPKPDTPAPAKKPACPCPKAVAKATAVPPVNDDRSATSDGSPAEHFQLATLVPVVRVIRLGPPPDPSPQLLLLCQRLRC